MVGCPWMPGTHDLFRMVIAAPHLPYRDRVRACAGYGG